MSVRVYLSLGSNIAPREHLPVGMRYLREEFGTLRVSPVYRSVAVGFDGAAFVNLVVGIDVALPVGALGGQLRELELANGRAPDASKYSSRTLDVDILTYGEAVGRVDGIELPRDEIYRHRYVIQPLADLAPGERDPATGRTFYELCQAVAASEPALERIDDRWLLAGGKGD